MQDQAGSKIILSRGRVNSRMLVPLAPDNGLTQLMLQTRHKEYGHVGVSTLISILGHQYFIIGVKRKLKSIARKCSTCQRINAHTMEQQMGMLPACRTELHPLLPRQGWILLVPSHSEKVPQGSRCSSRHICAFLCAWPPRLCTLRCAGAWKLKSFWQHSPGCATEEDVQRRCGQTMAATSKEQTGRLPV